MSSYDSLFHHIIGILWRLIFRITTHIYLNWQRVVSKMPKKIYQCFDANINHRWLISSFYFKDTRQERFLVPLHMNSKTTSEAEQKRANLRTDITAKEPHWNLFRKNSNNRPESAWTWRSFKVTAKVLHTRPQASQLVRLSSQKRWLFSRNFRISIWILSDSILAWQIAHLLNMIRKTCHLINNRAKVEIPKMSFAFAACLAPKLNTAHHTNISTKINWMYYFIFTHLYYFSPNKKLFQHVNM